MTDFDRGALGRVRDAMGQRVRAKAEAHPRLLTPEQLDEMERYTLECIEESKAGLPINGRFVLSMIAELRELREASDAERAAIATYLHWELGDAADEAVRAIESGEYRTRAE